MAEPLQCPKCSSKEVAGLMQAFWVSLKEDGTPKEQWRDWESNTELTTDRECADCGHQWQSE